MLSRNIRAVSLSGLPSLWLLLICFFILGWTAPVWCTDLPQNRTEVSPPLKGHALIVVGLAGDEDREKLFAETVGQWRNWLTDSLGFDSAEVRVLYGRTAQNGLSDGPATRAVIEKEAVLLKKSLRPDNRLWVFFLGHANFDGEHAWFHLPGPDLREDELGKLFRGISCNEQVFWLTGSESGRFLKGLSAKGRMVIAATRSSNEDNETEYPAAFSAVIKRSPDVLDLTKDGKVCVLELYYLVASEVQARYAADKRAPTEHSQLDDNGDLKGTERPLAASKDNTSSMPDGILAFKTILPYKKPVPAVIPPEPIPKDSVKK
jgi:hypothetical protein